MIEAYRRNKLGAKGTSAHDRSENLFTSTVFGLLCYLPPRQGLIPFLSKAQEVEREDSESPEAHNLDSLQGRMRLAEAQDLEIVYWPRLWREREYFGELDLLVTLKNGTGEAIALIGIEVKLHSPKSKRRYAADNEPEPKPTDQLAKYWAWLAQEEKARKVPATLLYLTAHATAPKRELEESLREGGNSIKLGWLSWHDVWDVVNGFNSPDSLHQRIARDLVVLLEYKSMHRFRGFRSQGIALVAPTRFWLARFWFAIRPQTFPIQYRFWKEQ